MSIINERECDYKDDMRDFEEEYSPQLCKSYVPFLIGLLTATIGNTMLYLKLTAIGIICFVILLVCVVWIVKEQQRHDRMEYDRYLRIRKAISVVASENEKMQTEISLKADKPAKSNIRPGSRQSERYRTLIGGENNDVRRKDQTTACY